MWLWRLTSPKTCMAHQQAETRAVDALISMSRPVAPRLKKSWSFCLSLETGLKQNHVPNPRLSGGRNSLQCGPLTDGRKSARTRDGNVLKLVKWLTRSTPPETRSHSIRTGTRDMAPQGQVLCGRPLCSSTPPADTLGMAQVPGRLPHPGSQDGLLGLKHQPRETWRLWASGEWTTSG